MTNTFTVARSVVIAAQPSAIAPEISDLARHSAWSPFAKPDPKVQERIDGPAGAGQRRTFTGGRTGAGCLQVDSAEANGIAMTLAMTKPFRSMSAITYRFMPEAGGTRVTWQMTGAKTLAGRMLGLFFDADAMMGRMFEEGLTSLKQQVERMAGGQTEI